MINKELISIIIPVYNGENYIEACVKSILNNTFENLEVLLVDDGSIDNSYKVCQKISEEDNRVKAYTKSNEGIAKTRNFGLEKATGEYICFADQDDFIPQNAYENLYNNIKGFGSDLCIGSVKRLYNSGKTKTEYQVAENHKIEGKQEIEEYLLKMTSKCRQIEYFENNNTSYSWTVWNCIYKNSIVKENNIKIERIVNYEDDFLFNFNYIKYCKSISFEKEVVYYWKKNIFSESSSDKYIDEFYEKRKKLIEYIIAQLRNLEQFDENRWTRLSIEKNFVNTIINESTPQNTKSNKNSVEYLLNIYEKDIKALKLDFRIKKNVKNLLRNSNYITYKLAEKGKIKKAFYINKYVYYKFIRKIINFINYFR